MILARFIIRTMWQKIHSGKQQLVHYDDAFYYVLLIDRRLL